MTTTKQTMEQTREFNSNGIQLLEAGYLEEAKDLFRAALADMERCKKRKPRCVTPECIFEAEYHLNNKAAYLSRPKGGPGSSFSLSKGGFVQSSASPPDKSIPAPTLHLFARPLLIKEPDFDNAKYISAVNVFNLGLVHQLQDRSCPKARSFYEVAASILALDTWDVHSALLRAAVTNNFSVWAYQNNQFMASRAALLELARMVALWPGDKDQAAGFQSNLRLLDFLSNAHEDDEEETDSSDGESNGTLDDEMWGISDD